MLVLQPAKQEDRAPNTGVTRGPCPRELPLLLSSQGHGWLLGDIQ